MTYASLLAKVRFLFSDTATANQVFRESLTSRPGNIIDGNNTVFLLLNRRIVSISAMYNFSNQSVNPADYVLSAASGKLTFLVPPIARIYVDYSWQKLTDAEIDEAIVMAAGSGNFDPQNVPDAMSDYAARYIVSNCYLSAASKAAEYYTMSASGKQVSKSELFNHYTQMADKFLADAKSLRTDQRTDRGDRDIPSGMQSTCDWVDPYFPQDGGL